MKQHVLTVATLLMLVGCHNQDDASQTSLAPAFATSATETTTPPKPAPATDTSRADPGKTCVGQPGCSDLPPGVAIAASHELRNGRIYTNPAGAKRRQLALELMDGDMAAVLEAFKNSMLDAGFTSNDTVTRENGIVSIRFEKDGYGAVNVWANPSVGTKPKNPDAKSILGVDMPHTR